MSTIHFVMMGKGGVGKSTIAVLLAQWLKKTIENLHSADLDPTNASFHAFKALNAEHINIADPHFNIDPVQFDILMEKILSQEADWVIDTGAATFLPFMNYLIQNDVLQFLEDQGRKVIVHTPLVGGPAMEETVRGLKAILELSNTPVVVWENEFFGPVVMKGKRFVETAGYDQFKSRIVGLVRLVKRDPKQAEKDLLTMFSHRLTWEEALNDQAFLLMQRQRLTVMRRELDEELEKLDM